MEGGGGSTYARVDLVRWRIPCQNGEEAVPVLFAFNLKIMASVVLVPYNSAGET